jgi:DNA-binding transcriptional ArsR family regulator
MLSVRDSLLTRSIDMKSPAVATRARRFAALGDPTRLQVFQLVSRRPLSVAEIAQAMPVSRPAVSQHLRVLADAGLVQCDSVGTRNIYRPDTDAVASMRSFIDSLWDVGLARFRAEAESLARERAVPTPRHSKESR